MVFDCYLYGMRLVVYNIRYGTGVGWNFHVPFPFSGYLKPTHTNVARITEFLDDLNPDIVGLLEVDNGSYRHARRSQAVEIAEALGFDHVYESKYSRSSLAKAIPVLRQQGNAFLTNQSIHARVFHYFLQGIKRLVIELELDSVILFLVHLSLAFRHRHFQLRDLYHLFRNVDKPVIVAGDFNAFWGDHELDLFLGATGLVNANPTAIPTFPSHNPKKQLDFVLHSPEIQVQNFQVPNVCLSDHMPLVCDFGIGKNSRGQ